MKGVGFNLATDFYELDPVRASVPVRIGKAELKIIVFKKVLKNEIKR